jgi:gas vesicle protein
MKKIMIGMIAMLLVAPAPGHTGLFSKAKKKAGDVKSDVSDTAKQGAKKAEHAAADKGATLVTGGGNVAKGMVQGAGKNVQKAGDVVGHVSDGGGAALQKGGAKINDAGDAAQKLAKDKAKDIHNLGAVKKTSPSAGGTTTAHAKKNG